MIIGIDCSRAFGEDKTGTENYSYHLVTQILQLPEAKSHLFVLFTRPNAIIPEQIRQNNVFIYSIKLRYLWTQIGLAMMTWRKYEIRNTKYALDVLWVPAHTLPVLRNPWVKTVVTIHGLEYRWLPEYRNLLQRWYLPLSTFYAVGSADRLIAVSEFTKQQLIKELHTTAKKIKVIQEGVRLSSRLAGPAGLTNALDKYGLRDKKYILFVGSVQPRKNLPALIEAFALFAPQFPDHKLVIAGGTGWMAESVMESPGRYGVQEKVVLTGRVTDSELSALYQSALLYVQPSITEGFGLPVLEAMMMGVPVVSSNGGALRETVGSAGTVVAIGEGFVRRLAGAIGQTAGDSAKRKKMIAAGASRAKQLSWQKAATLTLKVLLN